MNGSNDGEYIVSLASTRSGKGDDLDMSKKWLTKELDHEPEIKLKVTQR